MNILTALLDTGEKREFAIGLAHHIEIVCGRLTIQWKPDLNLPDTKVTNVYKIDIN